MPPFLPAKAMVFAAGLGTRMRPLTDRLPKPLVAVAGKPLIDHTLDRFAAAGVDMAIVNVHYLAGQIEAHLAARKTPNILISDEREKLLDQGGGIAKVLPLLGSDPFFCPTRMPSGLRALTTIFKTLRRRGIPREWISCCSSPPPPRVLGLIHQATLTWRPTAA